ncbi:hypothetical protein XELAEV_18044864mg [Xenopus laevis]|uniref:Uncharacterized protein n=1 Tax=Xenopus laevis TaxID=8355 RepID=A0A974H3R8_XENLA|nr:hypothetical protein XELAEV_18044864mg [Xenopus laevis]
MLRIANKEYGKSQNPKILHLRPADILCKDQVAIRNTQKVYTILDHYSCASSNVVYMITCTRCSTGGIYIGETGQKLCMNHHRYKINIKSCDTPVGQHFCSQNHSLQDMQLFNAPRQGLNLGSGFMSHCDLTESRLLDYIKPTLIHCIISTIDLSIYL